MKIRKHVMIPSINEWPEYCILTAHFDITPAGVILDLITDKHIFYAEYDNNHKCTELTRF